MVAGPKIAAGALTFGFNVWLLRIWSPEQFGLFAICTTAIMLTDAILGSSIDLATLRLSTSHRDTDAPAALAIERAALQMKVVGVAAAVPIVLLAARPLSQVLFHQAGLESLIAISIASATALLLLRSVLVNAQVEQRFDHYTLLEAVHTLIKFGGVGLLILTSQATVYGVLAFFGMGPFVAFGLGMALQRTHSLWSVRVERQRIIELFRYVKWYALSGGVGNIVARMDLFILSAFASLSAAGLFAAGQTFAMIPWLIASYLSVVLSPRILPMMESGTCRGFYRQVQSVLLTVAAVSLASAIVALNAAVDLLPLAFRGSVDIFLILLVGNLVSFATFPVALPLVMFIRPRFILQMDCIALPVLLAAYSFVVSSHGAIGVAWVTTVSAIVRGGVVQVLAWRLSEPPHRMAASS